MGTILDIQPKLHFFEVQFPSYLRPRGAEAREKVVGAFVEYDENGGFETAGRLAQDRAKVQEKTGLDRRELARMAMSQSVGQFDNSATVTFAVLSFILHDPELLARIRSELDEHVTKHDDQGRRSVDTLRIGRDCPLLLSMFLEVLRWIAVGAMDCRGRDNPSDRAGLSPDN